MSVASVVPALELRNLTKSFDDLVANAGVSLVVKKGTIHGIVGENGAGKSTAMKMVYGMLAPDSGEILVHGRTRVWKSPLDAIQAGIGMVHQHFMLAGPYTALDNILLGAEPKANWKFLPEFLRPIDRERARRSLDQLARQYGLGVDLDAPVEELPVGVQQRIEILKLLYREASILVLDEPTAVLTPQETQTLFSNLRTLRDEGKTILVITHKLREVMAVTDRVTVFRGGKVTGEVETSQTSPQDLANMMVGRKVVLHVDVPPQKEVKEPVLEVKGLTLRGGSRGAGKGPSRHRLFDVTFDVHAGEIVGIAGVEGNGQTELLQALLHPNDPTCRSAGLVRIRGQDVTECGAAKIKALGVGYIPEDRQREGLLLERPARENFLLGHQRRKGFSNAGLISYASLNQTSLRAMDEYDVRPRRLDVLAGRMSGGNQQKLIVAREFMGVPWLLIAAQTTRGVDVGAIEFIHRKIVHARTEGAGVLLVSSELDEILTLADRILVMYEGSIVARFNRGEVSERELGLRMGGAAGTEGRPS